MLILAGDIGGTKTWLQIAECDPSDAGRCRVLYEKRYASADFPHFDELLNSFMQSVQQQGLSLPVQGCIGVAGPVESDNAGNDHAKVTNLPWRLNGPTLAAQHGLARLRLINDFQAVAYGLETLEENELMILQPGEKVEGRAPMAVIGAGTGLGQALLVWEGDTEDGFYTVIPSEGGHADFAPGNQTQRELLDYLAQRQPRVSVEDVLSGRGLVNIYHHLVQQNPQQVDVSIQQAMAEGDAAAVLGNAGLSAPDSLAGQALGVFVSAYGTQAGNYALTCMASGGVYIAGGIGEKIRACFRGEEFVKAFRDKGPMQSYMCSIPVKLVLNPQVGLQGAALLASRL
ncbi:MAG TPA: glucokinase [Gammaproteobacteria bacterium]|nr:glucokinase [Gammaproteobacteria bacterium]